MSAEVTGTTGSKVSDVLLSWEFGETVLQQGTISCSRSVGSKDVWVDVVRLSETPRLFVYAGVEGDPLTAAHLVGKWTPLGEGVELEGLVEELQATHGAETTLTLALANWGTEDIRLEDSCPGLAYVVDHGEGFPRMEFPDTDNRTILPGTMGLFSLDPEGANEGYMTVALQDGDEIVIAWGENGGSGAVPSASGSSSGCSSTGGLPFALIIGLPVMALTWKRHR